MDRMLPEDSMIKRVFAPRSDVESANSSEAPNGCGCACLVDKGDSSKNEKADQAKGGGYSASERFSGSVAGDLGSIRWW